MSREFMKKFYAESARNWRAIAANCWRSHDYAAAIFAHGEALKNECLAAGGGE